MDDAGSGPTLRVAEPSDTRRVPTETTPLSITPRLSSLYHVFRVFGRMRIQGFPGLSSRGLVTNMNRLIHLHLT